MRLLSNIIKSTQVSVSSTNKFSIEVIPIYNEINFEQVLEQEEDLLDEPVEAITEQEILRLAEVKAEKIIQNANEKANDIITKAVCDAENEAEMIKQEAQKSGYDLGYNGAIEQVASLKKQAQLELENAVKQKEEILLSCEPQMVEMILNLSKTILGKAFDINPQIILLLVKKGLEQSSTNGKLFIHVSKLEYDSVVENLPQLIEFTGNSDLEVVKDLSLNKGDCIIETPFGNVDSSFDLQFEAVKNDLIYILENR